MEIEFGVQKFSLLWCEVFGFMRVFLATVTATFVAVAGIPKG